MAIRAMKYLGETVLRKKAAPVKKVVPDVRTLIKDMYDTMYENHGQGLAAPQIGVSKRIIIVDVHEDEETRHKFGLINPRIISFFGEHVDMEEGCLSIPGLYLPIRRREAVNVEYQDEKGRKTRMEAHGMLARCIQHEVDHLNGILFFDHTSVSEAKARLVMVEFLKAKEKRADADRADELAD